MCAVASSNNPVPEKRPSMLKCDDQLLINSKRIQKCNDCLWLTVHYTVHKTNVTMKYRIYVRKTGCFYKEN